MAACTKRSDENLFAVITRRNWDLYVSNKSCERNDLSKKGNSLSFSLTLYIYIYIYNETFLKAVAERKQVFVIPYL